MLTYLITITLAGLLGIAASHVDNPYLRLLVGIASILPFCFVAGLRADTVGTDTNAYPLNLYNTSLESSLSETYESLSFNMEPLFIVLGWATTKIFGDFHVTLFVYQLATVLPILYCLMTLTPRSIGLGLVVYGFIFFPYSLNIVRQSISTAFLLLAITYALRGKYVRCAISVAVATGFHTTGLLGIAAIIVILVFKFQGEAKTETGKLWGAIAICLCIMAFLVLFVLVLANADEFLEMLVNIKSSYRYQLNYSGSGGWTTHYLILAIAFALLYFAAFIEISAPARIQAASNAQAEKQPQAQAGWEQSSQPTQRIKVSSWSNSAQAQFDAEDGRSALARSPQSQSQDSAPRQRIALRYDRASWQLYALMTLTLIGAVLCQLSQLSPQMYRTGMPFLTCIVLLAPRLYEESVERNKVTVFNLAMDIALLFFLWMYVINGYHDVYPYVSDVLTFLS